MPSPVDHDARRRHLAAIAADLIAREGLDAATIRRVATIAGFSTTVVTHYFATKRELLLWTYRLAAEEAGRRFDAARARDPADILACLETLLPIGDQGNRAWRVNLAFWQMAVGDPVFAAEQRWWTRHAGAIVAEVVAARYGADPRIDAKARMLVVMVQGIAIQALFDAGDWNPASQRDQLAAQIDLLFGAEAETYRKG